jgi:N-acetyl-anhydromuramyl-L-alanine amidase AmpD
MAYTPPTLPYLGPVAHSSGTGNLPIARIVIHCTVGTDGGNANGTAAYFRTAAAGGSAHYITDPGKAIQCARDNVVCWHAPPNPHSLGIEMECSLANQGKGHWTLPNHVAMMRITAKLVAQKCIQYGVPIVRLSVADLRAGKHGICGHNEVSLAFGQSTHWDPGPYFPWVAFIAMVQNEAKLINGTAGDQPMSAAEVQQILTAMAGYEATAGAEGMRYAALQNDTNDIQAKVADLTTALGALDARTDTRDTLAGQRWSQTQDAVTAIRADLAALTAAVQALIPVVPPVVPPKA